MFFLYPKERATFLRHEFARCCFRRHVLRLVYKDEHSVLFRRNPTMCPQTIPVPMQQQRYQGTPIGDYRSPHLMKRPTIERCNISYPCLCGRFSLHTVAMQFKQERTPAMDELSPFIDDYQDRQPVPRIDFTDETAFQQRVSWFQSL